MAIPLWPLRKNLCYVFSFENHLYFMEKVYKQWAKIWLYPPYFFRDMQLSRQICFLKQVFPQNDYPMWASLKKMIKTKIWRIKGVMRTSTIIWGFPLPSLSIILYFLTSTIPSGWHTLWMLFWIRGLLMDLTFILIRFYVDVLFASLLHLTFPYAWSWWE